METENKKFLTDSSKSFLTNFLSNFRDSSHHLGRKGNDNKINTVLFYEKIRVAVEYQEEHLVFKNAIARIIRRKYTLSSSITGEQLTKDLVSELTWADYVNPETISDKIWDEIRGIIERYLVLLKHSHSSNYPKHDLQKMIISWLACEIDETMKPRNEDDFLINYAYSILQKDLDLDGSNISPEENEMELKLIIFDLALKPDLPLAQYWLLKNIYSGWRKLSLADVEKFAVNFDAYYQKAEHLINHPLRLRYIQYVKRNIAPFLVLRSTLITSSLSYEKIVEEPARLHSSAMDIYSSMVSEVRKKVTRATFRALIFIFLSKMLLAFLVEVPFERVFLGSLNYMALIINISLPPALMFISGASVKSPSKKNTEVISQAISDILFENRLKNKPFLLLPQKPTNSFVVFNTAYSIISLAVLIGVLWLLLFLGFNVVSIVLFFFFVSVVSFFAFRIRNMALELAMKKSRDDSLTSVVELIFLPFIRVGKYLSAQFANFNPFILFLDFIIEAPMKTIVRIVNSWFRFVNSKKEEIEF